MQFQGPQYPQPNYLLEGDYCRVSCRSGAACSDGSKLETVATRIQRGHRGYSRKPLPGGFTCDPALVAKSDHNMLQIQAPSSIRYRLQKPSACGSLKGLFALGLRLGRPVLQRQRKGQSPTRAARAKAQALWQEQQLVQGLVQMVHKPCQHPHRTQLTH